MDNKEQLIKEVEKLLEGEPTMEDLVRMWSKLEKAGLTPDMIPWPEENNEAPGIEFHKLEEENE